MEAKNDVLRYGKIIQKRRLEIGLTQEQLAENISLSQAFVNKLERGAADVTAMQLRNFSALLTELGWSVSEFSEATGIEFAPALKNSKSRATKKDNDVIEVPVHVTPHSSPSIEDSKEVGVTFLPNITYKFGREFYICLDKSMATGDPNSLHIDDILHVDTQSRTLSEGKIYLIRTNNKALLVRRIRSIDKRLWFLSDAPGAEAIKSTDVEVIGQVTAWTRTYNA